MKIHSIGYHHSHGSDFVIDRPDGIGESWLFLLFHTPVLVRTAGKLLRMPAHTFLIYSGETPEYYAACEEQYMDDWFHFTVVPEDIAQMRALGLPLNMPLQIADAGECSDLIRSMTYEFHSEKLCHTEMTELYFRILLIRLSRQIHAPAAQRVQRASLKADQLVVLRFRIFHQTEHIGSIGEIAEEMAMSVSSLQHSYKALFGTSITQDLVQARLERAKQLLTATGLTLRQIAERCGYRSEFHLMRQFKERTGMTPTEYRKFCH